MIVTRRIVIFTSLSEYPVLNINGTLKKSSYGSQTADYTYNLANLLTEVNNANGSTQISKYSYTYYVDGNQKSKTESVAGTNKGTTNYTYDGLNRLVTEQAPNNTYSYQYDIYGNRSQMVSERNGTTNYTYDRIIKISFHKDRDAVSPAASLFLPMLLFLR
ncbi:hypothetical protein FMM68_00265 [Lachnospiraceae bacterium MD329]|nr:hypothetical protein [Lachnospiraceae bacterium MD329]